MRQVEREGESESLGGSCDSSSLSSTGKYIEGIWYVECSHCP